MTCPQCRHPETVTSERTGPIFCAQCGFAYPASPSPAKATLPPAADLHEADPRRGLFFTATRGQGGGEVNFQLAGKAEFLAISASPLPGTGARKPGANSVRLT